ncbi:MAG TPA: helix-turn-helix domain-containing protein, partial [Polyangiales bacterium]
LVERFRQRRCLSASDEGGSPVAAASPRAQRREQLKTLLSEHQGNVSKIATALGKPRAQIYRWLETYGLSVEGYREQSGAPTKKRAWRDHV